MPSAVLTKKAGRGGGRKLLQIRNQQPPILHFESFELPLQQVLHGKYYLY